MTVPHSLLIAALALSIAGCGTETPASGSSGTDPSKDTVTLRCSCGGTWREPRAELRYWPIPLRNRGRHGKHRLPGDLAEQIEKLDRDPEIRALRNGLSAVSGRKNSDSPHSPLQIPKPRLSYNSEAMQ